MVKVGIGLKGALSLLVKVGLERLDD